MFVSILSAVAMFATPETAQGGGKTPVAKPAMERICEKVEVVGSTIPKRKCVTRQVKTAEAAEDKGAEVGKAE